MKNLIYRKAPLNKKHLKSIFLSILLVMASTLNSEAQVPGWKWIDHAGQQGDESGYSVTVDKDGNYIVAGSFSSTIQFGAYNLTTVGSTDIFITKYDATGNVQWSKSFGGNMHDQANVVVTDTKGNIIVSGGFQSPTMIMGSDTLVNTGSWDSFVARIDTQGNVYWARQTKGVGHDNSFDADANSKSIVIGGWFENNLIVGTDTLFNVASGASDMYLIKYDTLGNVTWMNRAGGTGVESINAVSLDDFSNVYVAGDFIGPSISFDTITLNSSGNNDAFLAKYNNLGQAKWAKKIAGSYSDYAYAVQVDKNNDPVVSGYFGSSTLYFGADSIENIGAATYDAFIAKYDESGNFIWANRAGYASFDVAYALTIDKSNNIYMAGSYNNYPFPFAGDTLPNQGYYDIYIAKYDENGSEIWAKGINGNRMDEVQSNSIDVAPDGSVALTGWFYSDYLTFDSVTINNANPSNFITPTKDMFIAVLGPSLISNDVQNITVSADQLWIYPNPTDGVFTLKNSVKGKSLVEVFDYSGKKLLQFETNAPLTKIDMSDQPNGYYLVRLTAKEQQPIFRKVIINK